MGLVLLYFFIYSMSLLLLRKNKNAVWFALTSLLLLSITALHRNWEIQTQNRLIVFNQNKEMQCELLKANTYSVLMGIDSLSYATRNAHIGFGANEKSHFINHAVLEINKNKILIIDSNTSYQTQFPVDVLIVNGAKNHVDINTIISSISPKKIVINNQHEIRNWEKQCAAAHISLHNTSTDGAFVFPY
jgi:hypothetical protein